MSTIDGNSFRGRPTGGETTSPTKTGAGDVPATAKVEATVVVAEEQAVRAALKQAEDLFEHAGKALPGLLDHQGGHVGGGAVAAVRATIEKARSAVQSYFANRTNRKTAAIGVARTSVGMGRWVGFTLLRGTPLLGNVLNAVAAVLDLAHAAVRTAAALTRESDIPRRDLVADWARVCTDVAGIFFPVVGMAGGAAHGAYSLASAAVAHHDRDQPPTGGHPAPTVPPGAEGR